MPWGVGKEALATEQGTVPAWPKGYQKGEDENAKSLVAS